MNVIERAIVASTKCHCKHERRWHDPCSQCFCPGYLPEKARQSDPDTWNRWKADLNARRKAEDGR